MRAFKVFGILAFLVLLFLSLILLFFSEKSNNIRPTKNSKEINSATSNSLSSKEGGRGRRG